MSMSKLILDLDHHPRVLRLTCLLHCYLYLPLATFEVKKIEQVKHRVRALRKQPAKRSVPMTTGSGLLNNMTSGSVEGFDDVDNDLLGYG